MHGQTNQTIQQWGASITNLSKAVEGFAGNSSLQGKAMTSAQTYMREVHGTLLQTFLQLMNDYSTSLLLYKDGYYQIDTHNHAELPENVYKGLHSDLGKSKQRFEHQLEQLTAAKLRVAGLVNYQGSSHTKTKFTYEKLMKDIKHLDESITQYEEMHARQDLQAFKELLDATKSLIAEHSSRDRSIGSYQSGAFGKLPSVQRFMVAYEQVTAKLNDRMGIIQAALERDQVRMEALHAEERTKQGLMNLVFGVLTVLAGVSALVMSGGTALPIMAPILKIAGVGMYLLGSSNSFEEVQNIILGSIGDGKTVAFNPIRDTIFFGNAELYNHVGQVFSLTTGVLIPIAQTKSIAQGLSQFFWGTVGGLATGQVAYHGTKLLGGNEETAQLMNLLGNFVGGYAASKAASKFSLNKVKNNISEPNFANYKEFLTKKIDEFKTNFKDVETRITVETRNAAGEIQRIQLKAIGIDETGNIRIQDYTTAEHVSPEIKKAAFAKFDELASRETSWNTAEKQAAFKETFDMYAERTVKEGAVPNKETYYKQYVTRQYDYSEAYKKVIKQPYLESGASSVVSGDNVKNFAFNNGKTVGRMDGGVGQGNFTTSILEDSALLYDENGLLKSASEIATVKGVRNDAYDSGMFQYEYTPELVKNMDKEGLIQFANGDTPGSSSLNLPGAKTWAGSNINMSESELLMPTIDMQGHSYDEFLYAIKKQGYYEIKNPTVVVPGENTSIEIKGIFRINQWSK